MIGLALAPLVLGAGLLAGAPPLGQDPAPSGGAVPYRKAGEQPLDFRGPGRDAPEPAVDEVVLGWFGPPDPDDPEDGETWRGATLALEQENAAGGYRGKPFRLEAAWSKSPWQAGIVGVTRLVYERGAWAVIGGKDGASTHLAVQVALKAYVLLLSPGSTDATVDHANVPWLFSLPPSNERLAAVLAGALAAEAAAGPFAVVSATDHDSHAALLSLRRALAARRLTPAEQVELSDDPQGQATLATRLRVSAARAVVVLAGSSATAAMVKALRAAGYAGAILGGAPAARVAFARAAGPAADGVAAPCWTDETAPAWRAFADAYRRRWGADADGSSASGYDAVRITAAAIRVAGLNRPRIRDAVRTLAPYAGAGGVVRWDALGRAGGEPWMAVWGQGRLTRPGGGPRFDPASGPRGTPR